MPRSLLRRSGFATRAKFFDESAGASTTSASGSFVAGTAGMVNLRDIEASSPVAMSICVTGLCGEILRTFRPNKPVIGSTADLLDKFRPQLRTRLGLLKPEVAAQLRERAISELFDVADVTAKPHELFDSFSPCGAACGSSRIEPRKGDEKDHRISTAVLDRRNQSCLLTWWFGASRRGASLRDHQTKLAGTRASPVRRARME